VNCQCSLRKHHQAGNLAQYSLMPLKWFNDDKGFSFIEQDGGKDVLVQFIVIQGGGCKSLKEGQRVTIEVSSGTKGTQAENITPI
jgi:cold shock protein